ncbi:hypothetical protein C8Q73DRAFT_817496 [Cubamyces lactineus]|nr:hypothetical protein C8Q73DRAFT_817496 [Cubamyces lactineus]
MSSSELSNALNPDVVARPRRRHTQHAVPLIAPPTPALAPQQPVPHRSELELAIAPPSVEPPARNGNPVLELYRVIATAGEAAAAERKRRIAWEREQEAKTLQRQKEMERQILDMREEINMLKAYITSHPHIPTPGIIQGPSIVNTIPSTAHIEPVSPTLEPSPQTPLSPISPVPTHPAVPQALFVEGSSSHPLNAQQYHVHPSFSPASAEHLAPPTPQSTGITNTPVPSSPLPEAIPPRKRPRLVAEDESDYQSDTDDDADDPSAERGGQRRNGHDGRCLTIHHAMRIHIRKMMKLKHDDDLPESHFEGAPLLADQPVRFVWNKTTKQSAHNAAMKRRIVSDLKANRTRYKHVPDKEFNKRNLESVFDQVFTTLRQRHKAQQDATAASRLQRRENQKALKARRLQRKKAKLSNRVDARKKIDAFAQPVFETALHQDCMSSEESDGEYVEDGEKVQVFRTRGPSWRSARLLRYYAILDDQDRLEKSMKPKRGIGRRIRREGPPKDGLFLPPKGVARWMVSRRWIQETESMRPDLVDALRELVVDVAEQETEVTRVMLGAEESEDEATQGTLAPDAYAHISDTSYSLHNALQPV